MKPAGSDLSLARAEGTKPAPVTWSRHAMTSPRPWPDVQTEVVVTSGETPKRVDLFPANRDPALSRAMIQRLIEEGRIRINDQPWGSDNIVHDVLLSLGVRVEKA